MHAYKSHQTDVFCHLCRQLLVYDTTGAIVPDFELEESFNMTNHIWLIALHKIHLEEATAESKDHTMAELIERASLSFMSRPLSRRQRELLQWHWDMQFGFDAASEGTHLSWKWFPAWHSGWVNWENIEEEATGREPPN